MLAHNMSQKYNQQSGRMLLGISLRLLVYVYISPTSFILCHVDTSRLHVCPFVKKRVPLARYPRLVGRGCCLVGE